MLIYGIGGITVPFIFIKLIDLLLVAVIWHPDAADAQALTKNETL